jgi:Ankyrin repeats (3 copies)
VALLHFLPQLWPVITNSAINS